jgi:hypothetical protein
VQGNVKFNYGSPFGSGATINTGPSVAQGLYASRPGSGVVVGDQYISTDGPLKSVWNGSVWNTYLHDEFAAAPGPSSGWTQVNFGGKVTLTDVGGTIGMQIADTASFNIRLVTKNAPATPYHVEFFMRTMGMHLNSTVLGAYFYDGTKLMSLDFLAQSASVDTIRVQKMTSTTVDNTTAKSTSTVMMNPYYGGIWLRLGNNGTNLTFDFAYTRGDWINFFTEAVGTYITPTAYGWGGMCVTGVGGNFIYASLQGINVTA